MINPFFRRPKSSSSTTAVIEDALTVEIPTNLSFDRIVAGQTCFPCATRDFLNYLRFVEHSDENLQFYLWAQDYSIRFSQLPNFDQKLSPSWPCQSQEYSFVVSINCEEKPWNRPILNSQPFRAEIERMKTQFLLAGSPQELNLSSRERRDVLSALSFTTHPSALASSLQATEISLRCQSHPNFIRYALGNANGARLLLVRLVGIFMLLMACIIGVTLTLSHRNRWWRVIGIIPLMISVVSFVNAGRGICFMLLMLGHKRLLMPWELWQETSEHVEMQAFAFYHKDDEERVEEWMKTYRKKGLMARMFEKRLRVQDPDVRKIQTVLILQSWSIATIIAIVYCAIFVSLPPGNLY